MHHGFYSKSSLISFVCKKAESKGKCITAWCKGLHKKEAFSDTYFESPSELFFRSAWSCHICSHHEFYKINGSTGVFVKDPENVVDKVFWVSQWRDFIVDFHYGIFVEDSIRTFFTKILMPFSNKQKMHIFLEFILTQNCESNKTLTRTSHCLKIYIKSYIKN